METTSNLVQFDQEFYTLLIDVNAALKNKSCVPAQKANPLVFYGAIALIAYLVLK